LAFTVGTKFDSACAAINLGMTPEGHRDANVSKQMSIFVSF